MGGATNVCDDIAVQLLISIHAPRGGSDCPKSGLFQRADHFNPRSPWGERPASIAPKRFLFPFQSTLPVGGATCLFSQILKIREISIHAPRGGSDGCHCPIHPARYHFNPRSPWGERLSVPNGTPYLSEFQSTLPVGGATIKKITTRQRPRRFQSTLPVGGATGCDGCLSARDGDFNPRSPWGERPPRSCARARMI